MAAMIAPSKIVLNDLLPEGSHLVSIFAGHGKIEQSIAKKLPDRKFTIIDNMPPPVEKLPDNMTYVQASLTNLWRPEEVKELLREKFFIRAEKTTRRLNLSDIQDNILIPGLNLEARGLTTPHLLAINPDYHPPKTHFKISFDWPSSWLAAQNRNRKLAIAHSKKLISQIRSKAKTLTDAQTGSEVVVGNDSTIKGKILKTYSNFTDLKYAINNRFSTAIFEMNDSAISIRFEKLLHMMEQMSAFTKPRGQVYLVSEYLDTFPFYFSVKPTNPDSVKNLLVRSNVYKDFVHKMLINHFKEQGVKLTITPTPAVKEIFWPKGVALDNPWGRDAVSGYILTFEKKK